MLSKKLVLAAAGNAAGEGLYLDDVFSIDQWFGSQNARHIKNDIALADGFNIKPGTPLAGGYFAGFISTSQNGVATHALIVAPAATGYNGKNTLNWKTSNTSESGNSDWDGASNTSAKASSTYPAINYCAQLSTGGYSDWYLPSIYEFEVAFTNLSPSNHSTQIPSAAPSNQNTISVPKRPNVLRKEQVQLPDNSLFHEGGTEAFVGGFNDRGIHWTSTVNTAYTAVAWEYEMKNGRIDIGSFNNQSRYVRAFRKEPISSSALDDYRVTGEGGLVWMKNRDVSGYSHFFFDTERGVKNAINSASMNAQVQENLGVVSFYGDGFALGGNDAAFNGGSSNDYCSWTFRKCPGFFDVVTYTGNDTAGRTIAHSLGSTPGMIIVKNTGSNNTQWVVWHAGYGDNTRLYLNSSDAGATSQTAYVRTASSSTFTVGNNYDVNALGQSYVAYIFGNDDQSFGENGNEAIIKCGSYTGTGSAGLKVTLGFEPQWLLVKNVSSSSQDWTLVDTLRGFNFYNVDHRLDPNNTSSEENSFNVFEPTYDGFFLGSSVLDETNQNGSTHVYVAIGGPRKPVTAATECFAQDIADGQLTNTTYRAFNAPFRTDFGFFHANGTYVSWNPQLHTRILGSGYLRSRTNDAFAKPSSPWGDLDTQRGFYQGSISADDYCAFMFKRSKNFHNQVTYFGNDTNMHTIPHGLGQKPGLVMVKQLDASRDWMCQTSESSHNTLRLNQTGAANTQDIWATTAMDDTNVYLGNDSHVNGNGNPYLMLSFGTVEGISKTGGYTGNGTNQNIDCGFTAGARWVLIKSLNAVGDWWIFNSEMGINTGNDRYVAWQSNNYPITNADSIDPYAAGFNVVQESTANINVNGRTYFFFAIA